jgi:hypothetical protein
MIVSKILGEYERRTLDIQADDIAGRIRALVADRRLQAQGDLSNWRHSEIRR